MEELFCNKIKNSSYKKNMNDKIHIFLDIDGVLATTHQYHTNRKKWHPTYDCYRFDEKCVKVFNEILGRVDAVIVLSSDWKTHYDRNTMNEILEWNGVNGTIHAFTPSSWGSRFTSVQQLEECRADEIKRYVEKHKIKKWIAIDDLDLAPFMSDENFVRTPRENEGIKQSGVKDKILKKIL
jgi:hypothetical protein